MTTGNDATPVPEPAGTPRGNPNQDARSGSGQYVRTPETAHRDARAAELRAEGWTFEQIANELGFSNKSNARQAVRRALRDIVQGPAEKLLALHMERLETLYEAAVEVLEADHIVVSHGQIVRDDTGQPLTDHGPKLAAIREARSTLDSFWTLTGMKKPAKVEHSGGVTYEIIGVSPEELT
jgi:transcriptional regulator with XRE-family HTH domain